MARKASLDGMRTRRPSASAALTSDSSTSARKGSPSDDSTLSRPRDSAASMPNVPSASATAAATRDRVGRRSGVDGEGTARVGDLVILGEATQR